MLLSLFIILFQLISKLVVCQNASSSQVPKNHRMENVGGEGNNNLGELDWGPNSLESFSSRFEGYKSNNDFLSDSQVVRQQAGPMFLPINLSHTIVVPHMKPIAPGASNRWSTAYSHVPEEAIGSVSVTSIGTHNTTQTEVTFDDDGEEYISNNTGTFKVPKNYETSASNLNEQSLSLSEAQRELDESLMVQGKLLSLLNRSKPTGTTSRPEAALRSIPKPMATLNNPMTRLMSAILPQQNTAQHPARRRSAPPGAYSRRYQHNSNRQQSPPFSRPLMPATVTTATSALPVQPIQASGDEEETSYPAIVSSNLDALHSSTRGSSKISQSFQQNLKGAGLLQEQEAQPSKQDESARWQRFYKHQRQVNPVTMGSVFSFPVESNYLDEEMQAEDEERKVNEEPLMSNNYHDRLPSSGSRGPSKSGPEMAGDKWSSMDANELEQLMLGEADLFPATSGRHKLGRPLHHHQLARLQDHHRQHGDERQRLQQQQPGQSASNHHMASSRLSPKSLAAGGWYQPYPDDEELLLRAAAASKSRHQVVHVIGGGDKKGHGKYLWPIVGGGLTMLMGFLIISNILLSIPLLAIGASSLLNNNPLGVTQSQQLVPVYNLSQLIAPPRTPAGRRRRRHAPWLEQDADREPGAAPDGLRLPIGAAGLSPDVSGARLESRTDELTRSVASLVGPVTRAAAEALLAAPLRLSRLLNWRGGKLWIGSRQVLKAAYCHRPIKIKQPIVSHR